MNAFAAPRIALGAIAAGMIFLSASAPADSQFAVNVISDVANVPNWIRQDINMGLQYARQYEQLQNEITTVSHGVRNLAHATGFSLKATDLSSLTNQVVTLNNQYPTAAGTKLATILVAAGNGSLNSVDLSDLQTRMGTADGNLQALGVVLDGTVAETAAVKENTLMIATTALQEQADLNLARMQQPQMLDVSWLNGGTGGFTAQGLKDHSQNFPL